MLAPTFKVFEEDTDIYTEDVLEDSTATSSSQRQASSQNMLSLRTSNVQTVRGMQKTRVHSKSSLSSKHKRKNPGQKRAFGAVLVTGNQSMVSQKSGKTKGNKVRVPHAKGSNTRKSRSKQKQAKALRQISQNKNVTAIEVCHKGPGKHVYVDPEEAALFQTNKNATKIYHRATINAMLGGDDLLRRSGRPSMTGFTAPIDEEEDFAVFEDDDDVNVFKDNVQKQGLQQGDGAPAKNAKAELFEDDVLESLEGADLW